MLLFHKHVNTTFLFRSNDELTVNARNTDSNSFSGFKKATKHICLVNTRMGVLFQIAAFVRFNYFKAHCYVLWATIVAMNIVEKHNFKFYNNVLIFTTITFLIEPVFK